MHRSAEPWLAYIAMERSLRNLHKVRSLYKRCYARQFADGSQMAFCQAWLRFEREEGRWARNLATCVLASTVPGSWAVATHDAPGMASADMNGTHFYGGQLSCAVRRTTFRPV